MSTEKSKVQKLVGIRLSEDQYNLCEKLAKRLYEHRVIPNDHIQTLFKLAVSKLVGEYREIESRAEAKLAASGELT